MSIRDLLIIIISVVVLFGSSHLIRKALGLERWKNRLPSFFYKKDEEG